MPGKTKEQITSFTFEGKTRIVENSNDVIKFLVDELAKRAGFDFKDLKELLWTHRKSWVSDDPKRHQFYNRPYPIRGTKWVIDTDMNTPDIKQKAHRIAGWCFKPPQMISFTSRLIPIGR